MYGRGVQEVKDQQRVLQLRRDEAEDDLRAARRGVRDAELDLSSSHWEVGGDPDEAQREVDRAKGNATAASGLLVGIEREWDLLVERREHLDRECIAALTGEGVLGSMSRLSGGGAGGNPFAGLSAIDMLVMARTDRRTLERLSTSDPAAVQEWWAGLGEDQQDALVSAMPGFIGALNGVPALSRVAANRLLAAEQLRKIRSQRSFADVDGAPTLRSEFGAGDDLIRYLERVVAGEVQLYLWQPENGAVIEMSGNPETARSALFVVPGTNASISEFTSTIPTTRFAGRLARDADPAGSVVAFTVLTGPMPYLTADPFDLWSNGPQNNAFAAARAPELAAFEKGIFATLPGRPDRELRELLRLSDRIWCGSIRRHAHRPRPLRRRRRDLRLRVRTRRHEVRGPGPERHQPLLRRDAGRGGRIRRRARIDPRHHHPRIRSKRPTIPR